MPKGATASSSKRNNRTRSSSSSSSDDRDDAASSCDGRTVLVTAVLAMGVALSIFQCVAFSVDLKVFQTMLTNATSTTNWMDLAILGGHHGSKHKQPTIGLTIVHCKEQHMDWIDDIPSHWKLVIYEVCGQRLSKSASRPMIGVGQDEVCTGYLQTMIELFDDDDDNDDDDDVPDIQIFLQPDALIGSGTNSSQKKYIQQHTPFTSIQELMDVTLESYWNNQHKHHEEEEEDHSNKNDFFLHYGPQSLELRNANAKHKKQNALLGTHPREILDLLGASYLKSHELDKRQDATHVRTRRGACFAVSTDLILKARTKEIYRKLQDSMYVAFAQQQQQQQQGSAAATQQSSRCRAMEHLWHVLFMRGGGSNTYDKSNNDNNKYVLATNDTVDHVWNAKRNYYEGTWKEELQRRKEAATTTTKPQE